MRRWPAPGMLRTITVGWPGDVLAEVARDQPAVEIVAAAGQRADHELDGAAFVERLDGGLRERGRGDNRCDAGGKRDAHHHGRAPCDCSSVIIRGAARWTNARRCADLVPRIREAGMALSPRDALARMLLMRRFEEMVITVARAHKLGRQNVPM